MKEEQNHSFLICSPKPLFILLTAKEGKNEDFENVPIFLCIVRAMPSALPG